MKRYLIAILLLLVVLALPATAAAAPPPRVEFTIVATSSSFAALPPAKPLPSGLQRYYITADGHVDVTGDLFGGEPITFEEWATGILREDPERFVARGTNHGVITIGDATDFVILRFNGQADLTDVRGHWTIVGARGEYRGMTGHGTYHGSAVFPGDVFSVDFYGTVRDHQAS